MRKIIYLTCLLLAFFFGGSLISTVLAPLFMAAAKIPGAIHIVSVFVKLIATLIPLLVLYRVLVFIKSKSLLIPSNFNGGLLIMGYVALAPALITIAGYIYLFANKAGVSGIPLAFAGMLTGILSAVPILCCELKDFYSNIPEK